MLYAVVALLLLRWGVGGAAQPVASQSTFGPPAAPVAVARTVLVPAWKVALTVPAAQVFQLPVTPPARVPAVAPLAVMVTGRAAGEPFADPALGVAGPPGGGVAVPANEHPRRVAAAH